MRSGAVPLLVGRHHPAVHLVAVRRGGDELDRDAGAPGRRAARRRGRCARSTVPTRRRPRNDLARRRRRRGRHDDAPDAPRRRHRTRRACRRRAWSRCRRRRPGPGARPRDARRRPAGPRRARPATRGELVLLRVREPLRLARRCRRAPAGRGPTWVATKSRPDGPRSLARSQSVLPSADGRTASTPRVLPASASVSGTGGTGLAVGCGVDPDRVAAQVRLPRRRAAHETPTSASPDGSQRAPLTPTSPAVSATGSGSVVGRSPSTGHVDDEDVLRAVARRSPTPSDRYFSSVMCRGSSLPGLPSGGVPALLRHPGHVRDARAVRGEPRARTRPAGASVSRIGSPPAASTTCTCGLPSRLGPQERDPPAVRAHLRRRVAVPAGQRARCVVALEVDGPQVADVLVVGQVGADDRHDGPGAVRRGPPAAPGTWRSSRSVGSTRRTYVVPPTRQSRPTAAQSCGRTSSSVACVSSSAASAPTSCSESRSARSTVIAASKSSRESNAW